MDLDLVWHLSESEAQIALVPHVMIKDRPLLWMVVSLHTYYPEHILAYGSEKAHYALVMGFGSFRTD